MRTITVCLLLIGLAVSSTALSSGFSQGDSTYVCGDADGNGIINVKDVVYLMDYMLSGGPEPQPLESGNADGCLSINMSDAASLFGYIFSACAEPTNCGGNADCRVSIPGNQVRLGCPVLKTVIDGDSVGIMVYVTNTVDIVAFGFGFRYQSVSVRITSVTKGFDLSPNWIFNGICLPETREVIVGGAVIYPSQALSPGSDRHVATLWVDIPVGTQPQCVDIDSAFVAPVGEFILTQACSYSSPVSVSIAPEYIDCGGADIVIGDITCPPEYLCGDFNTDGSVDIADAVYFLQYIFAGGPPPGDASGGDVNCDGSLNIADVVYSINYIFGGGPAPCAGC